MRFFNVTIPIGARACCSSTGKTLISGRLENLNTDIGTIVRKRPVIRSSSRTVTMGSDPISHEALAAHHKAETVKWWPIIKAAGIKPE